jgi:hypothetical protein
MILSHTFNEEDHIYQVPGQFVLSTSDIITLNGLADYGGIPKQVLAHDSWRGTQLHKAIQFFEEDAEAPDMPDEVEPYFRGYLKFKIDHDFEPIGALEKQIVYVHSGTEQPVGCTIDLRGLVKGQPYILDAKTTAKMYGKAMKQKCLAWRLQLASYQEATNCDNDWYQRLPPFEGANVGKAIVQVNKEGDYEFHDFSGAVDDDLLWDGCVRLAMAKLANGFQLERN